MPEDYHTGNPAFLVGAKVALKYDATVRSLCVWRDKTFFETVSDSGIGLGLTGGLR